MQTQTQIRELLESAGLAPQKMFGQNFLIDQNLMQKILELADVQAGQTVLEVGPGTGSLTEELLGRAGRLVAVEIDNGLAKLLADRFAGAANFVLIHGDVLADKHRISPQVLAAVSPAANLVSNLPYSIATPLLAQCLLDSWAALTQAQPPRDADATDQPPCRFDRLTFTVQRELADRLVAKPLGGQYGPVSVIVSLLGKATLGPLAPAQAFWPRPSVDSRIMRIDFDPQAAAALASTTVLEHVLRLAFSQRRKQLGSLLRRDDSPFAPDILADAFKTAGIEPTQRAEQVEPERFLVLANALVKKSSQ